jgi:hypothetical protein
VSDEVGKFLDIPPVEEGEHDARDEEKCEEPGAPVRRKTRTSITVSTRFGRACHRCCNAARARLCHAFFWIHPGNDGGREEMERIEPGDTFEPPVTIVSLRFF